MLSLDLKIILISITALLREASQTKKRGNLRNGPNRGRRQKIKKVISFSWGNFNIGGAGVFGNQKSPKFQREQKINKKMTHFNLMKTQKYNIL